VLTEASPLATGSGQFAWTPKTKPAKSKGPLSIGLSETPSAAFSGEATQGPSLPLTFSGLISESYVGGATCGEMVGGKKAKAVTSATFSGSTVSFE
jgi:hypothetical protein